MQDQRTTEKRADDEAIRAAISSAWDRVVVQKGRAESKRKPWNELDLAAAALEDLRAGGFQVTRWTITHVLGVLVDDGFFLQKLTDALYWLHGDVSLGPDFFDAMDEVAVEGVVNRAFGDS